MSLKTLLAVGESFSGTDVKPYEVKKERQIPIFGPPDGTGVHAGEEKNQNLLTSIPTELMEQTSAPQEELNFEKALAASAAVLEPADPVAAQPPSVEPALPDKVRLRPERRRIEEEPDERRRFLKRWSRPTIRRLTQAEMDLVKVHVVRNDLSDSDLELAPRRKERSAQSDLNPFAPRPIAAIGRPAHEKSGMGARVARWFGFLKKPKS
jgi:hypothetical protein